MTEQSIPPAFEATPEENAQEYPQAKTGEAEQPEAAIDLVEKLAEREQEILRLHADMENLRKRAERDIESARKFALERFVDGLLPVVDSLEMSIQAAEQSNTPLEKIREGNQMTLNVFLQTLEKFGVHPVHPIGERFNPEHHQAISVQPHEGPADHVVGVMQKGYLLKERLVRPALVVVSKPQE
ncbi:MAG: nucleotide exchange factor GrpE [Halothiobacillus sp.]|jgi:molecular chaperone GrpE|uniref:nucleotide exchange factor GrpE n=1 Tax=Halothiobacillus sp. TaxID=1891311 RepID=UPI002AD35159|nr:nucleotide exchange factor GrpE [Halothiobacillus sp.]MDA3877854.1 nucleotide exchange factor GrpE [Halothiobacillus sp.]